MFLFSTSSVLSALILEAHCPGDFSVFPASETPDATHKLMNDPLMDVFKHGKLKTGPDVSLPGPTGTRPNASLLSSN